MYIAGKLVDEAPLSNSVLRMDAERYAYIQGAINDLLEKWSDLLDEDGSAPRFTLVSDFFTTKENEDTDTVR